VNWFNIASVFTSMATDLKTDVSGLGLLASSFFLGVAIFQVPGGILAAKFGPKRTSFLGVLIASVCSLLVSFSSELAHAIVLRFLVGLGMAFFFAPGASLIAKYYRKGSEGVGIGLYNSAFDLGGALGLFGWALLAEVVGWRSSLLISGGFGVGTTILLLLALPRDAAENGFELKREEVRKVLLNRGLIILSLNMLGQGIGSTLIGSFMVYFLERALGLGAGPAGGVGALVLLVPLVVSPVGGKVYDKLRDPRSLMLLSGLGVSIGVGLPAFGGVYGAVVATVAAGLSYGVGFTIGFAAARDMNKARPEYESLALAWANSISISGGFFSPLVFSSVASTNGYPQAWLVGARSR